MLMLIRFLAFWENSFLRKILGNFARLEFNQNRGFYKFNKVTSKVVWLKTWTGHYYAVYGWLRIKQKSKTQTDLNTDSATKNK